MLHGNLFTRRAVSALFDFTGRNRVAPTRTAQAATAAPRPHSAKRMDLAAMMSALLACGMGAAQADVVFFDGTFDDANWTVTQSHDLISAHQIGSGGNPGSFRQTQISSAEQFDYAVSVNNAFLYNPSTQGAITAFTFENDLIRITRNFGSDYYLLIQQAGVSYYDLRHQRTPEETIGAIVPEPSTPPTLETSPDWMEPPARPTLR